MRIYKYTLDVQTRQLVQVTEPGEILSTGVDGSGYLCFWATADEHAPARARVFRVITTGERYSPEDLTYLGTEKIEGWFIAHVFEQPATLAQPDPVSAEHDAERRQLAAA